VAPQHQLEGGRRQPADAQRPGERVAPAGGDELRAPDEQSGLGAARELVAAATGQVDARGDQLGERRMPGELRLAPRGEQPAPLVDHQRHAGAASERDESGRRDGGGEAAHAEVAGQDLEHERGRAGQRALVVREVGAVGGAHLHQARAGGGKDLGDAERAADLDQLAARDHDLAAARVRRHGQQQGRGVVVDDERGLGAGGRDEQAGEAAQAVAAAPAGAVELEVAGGVGERGQRGGDLARQRRAAEVGVEEDAGGVEHPFERWPGLLLEGARDRVGQLFEGPPQRLAVAPGQAGAQPVELPARLDAQALPTVDSSQCGDPGSASRRSTAGSRRRGSADGASAMGLTGILGDRR